MTPLLTALIAFGAGIASFLSPCVLPLVPAYIGHLAGTSVSEEQDAQATMRTVAHAAFFVLGFSAVFVVLWASIGLVGWAIQATPSTCAISAGLFSLYWASMLPEYFACAGSIRSGASTSTAAVRAATSPRGLWGSRSRQGGPLASALFSPASSRSPPHVTRSVRDRCSWRSILPGWASLPLDGNRSVPRGANLALDEPPCPLRGSGQRRPANRDWRYAVYEHVCTA